MGTCAIFSPAAHSCRGLKGEGKGNYQKYEQHNLKTSGRIGYSSKAIETGRGKRQPRRSNSN